MDTYSIIIIIFLLVLVVGPFTLSIIAMSRTAAIKQLILPSQTSLNDLARQIAVLRDEVRLIQAQARSADAAEPEGLGDASPADEVVAEPPTSAAPPPYARPGSRTPETEPARAAAQQSAAPVSTAPASALADTPAVEKQSFEELLASRWLVWLGAVVIALGSVFLVKFSIDQGYLGPAVRDSLTFLLGVALIAGGEWLRRKPLQLMIAAIRPNYVPLALTASGLFAAFASVYAAHVFHGLLAPFPAFVGLAIVAFGAVGLSLLQGKFVALLGLLGAASTPLLIATPDPSLWALLAYLLVIQAACLMLVYYQGWWSLGFGALTSTIAWPVIIGTRLGLFLNDAEVIPLGIYLLVSAGAFFMLRHRMRGSEFSLSGHKWFEKLQKRPSDGLAWAAGLLVAVFIFIVVQAAEFSPVALILLAVFSALYLVVARFTPILEGLSIVAAIVIVSLMVTWPDLYFANEQGAYLEVFILFGALFGTAGF
ncbi:MAG: putative membrane protein, partial [Alphaproteobacteria bacterium]